MSSARAVLDLEVPAKKKPEPQARSVPPQPPPAAVSTGPGPENFKGDSLGEAEDPKEFFRKHVSGTRGPDEVEFGFAISTAEEGMIQQNAIDQELGELTTEQWNALSDDIGKMERNVMKILDKSGIQVSDQGHGGDGALIGSAWVTRRTEGWELLRRWLETDGELLNNYVQIVNNACPDADQMMWDGISDLGQRVLDVDVSFFDLDDVKQYFEEAHKPPPPPQEPNSGKGEDPKAFFRQMISTGKALTFSKAYQDVLEYMPDDFKKALIQGKFAEWHNNDPSFGDWFPQYDDDDDRWYEMLYYFEYYTEDRKLYVVAMGCDRDGDHDAYDSAEVGSKEAEALEDEYGMEGYFRCMKDYWQWVVDHGDDPLGYIMLPKVEVKKEWWAGFVRDGDKMRLNQVRQLTPEKPSPPAVDFATAKAKAATDPDWAKLIEYCCVQDDQGNTDVTEEAIVNEGGKWKNNQLNLKVVFTDTKVQDDMEDYIVQKAQEALNELNQPHDGQAAN